MKHKILIVDDEIPIQKVLGEILSSEGYDVEVAKDGLDCLSKLKEMEFDLVLLDIKLPKMDGVEALERIVKQYENLPVIMISGLGTKDDGIIELIKKGAFAFIPKPFDLTLFRESIESALNLNT